MNPKCELSIIYLSRRQEYESHDEILVQELGALLEKTGHREAVIGDTSTSTAADDVVLSSADLAGYEASAASRGGEGLLRVFIALLMVSLGVFSLGI